MDTRFQNLEFAAKFRSNAFKTLGNSIEVNGVGVSHFTDTVLRLDFPSSPIPYLSASKAIKRKWSSIDGSMVDPEVDSSLCLGLGRSSSSSDSKGSSATACSAMSSAKETEDESSMDVELDFSLHLGNNDKSPTPKKAASSNFNKPDVQPAVDLKLTLSTGPTESGVTYGVRVSKPLQVNKGSLYTGPGFLFNQVPTRTNHTFTIQDHSSSIITAPKSSVTCTSGISQQKLLRNNSAKICQIDGCGKGARGASGRCIAHGGGRRCQKSGCHKGAEGRTVYCKAHGGGRRCDFLGCTKSAEGRTDYCIAHGGGRRCNHEGCNRAARGKSGLCIRHGGGKRCQKEDCTKSAEGLSGLCIAHGGGRRCQYPECTKGAQGSTMFCKAHGGGKRCTYEGCTKGAEGSTPFCKGHGGGKRCSFQGGGICTKSVHGGTLYCVAHGGGKRCAVPECTKSARGRTDYCVRHGGGKRCKFEGCGKSAQGSTDFCKAHGGGKRCFWGHPGSEFGQIDGPCNSFARGRTGLCASHNALVLDKCVHGGATLGTMVQDPTSNNQEERERTVSENVAVMNIDESVVGFHFNQCEHLGTMLQDPTSNNQEEQTVSENVAVMNIDESGVGFHFNQCERSESQFNVLERAVTAVTPSVPEGRVHGGSLMAMLAAQPSKKVQ